MLGFRNLQQHYKLEDVTPTFKIFFN